MGRFIAVLLVILVVVGVIGFYRGWFEFSVRDQDRAETTASVTINKDKIQQDVDALRKNTKEEVSDLQEKVRHAFQKSKEGAELRATGKVETVGERRLTVSTSEKQILTLDIDSDTEIHIGGKRGSFVDVRPGDSVAVAYVLAAEGRNVAKSVTVEKRKD